MNKISKLWSKFSDNWFGNKYGRHCHWCDHIKSEDGESHCTYPKSKFNDGDRIRTWDGKYCAKECNYFKLSDWYIDDKNFYKSFPKAKRS